MASQTNNEAEAPALLDDKIDSATNQTADNQEAITAPRDAIGRGLVQLLSPAVTEVDARVSHVRESQVELRKQIDSLCEDLKKIAESDPVPMDLEPYVKRLNGARRRVVLVNSILQNVQDRLNKLHSNISKESARRKTLLDQVSAS